MLGSCDTLLFVPHAIATRFDVEAWTSDGFGCKKDSTWIVRRTVEMPFSRRRIRLSILETASALSHTHQRIVGKETGSLPKRSRRKGFETFGIRSSTQSIVNGRYRNACVPSDRFPTRELPAPPSARARARDRTLAEKLATPSRRPIGPTGISSARDQSKRSTFSRRTSPAF